MIQVLVGTVTYARMKYVRIQDCIGIYFHIVRYIRASKEPCLQLVIEHIRTQNTTTRSRLDLAIADREA